VCTDAPAAPSIPVTPFELTSDIAYVRLHGRNRTAWFKTNTTAATRFDYAYDESELKEVADKIRRLNQARAVHVLFNNCYADYGAKNARSMQKILSGS